MSIMPASDYANKSLKELAEVFTGPEDTVSEIKDLLSVLYLLEIRWESEHPHIAGLIHALTILTPVK